MWQGIAAAIAAISEGDWAKLTGPHGVAFVSVVAVIVLWGALLAYISRTNKREETRRKEELAARKVEDEARERRHVEIMTTQGHNAQKLIDLTAQSIAANINGTHAIQMLSHDIQTMTNDLKVRPCQAATFKQ